jgi:hypothetical protein
MKRAYVVVGTKEELKTYFYFVNTEYNIGIPKVGECYERESIFGTIEQQLHDIYKLTPKIGNVSYLKITKVIEYSTENISNDFPYEISFDIACTKVQLLE